MSEAIIKEKAPGKLPIRTKLGYGLGTASDSITYTLFTTYFIFFMTDVVGMAPALAGTISFLVILYATFVNPFIGFWSDNTSNKKGRRRPFIYRGVFPLAVFLSLLFLRVPFSGAAQFAYYVIISILVWTFYTLYVIPWTALGAELTQDYNERNMVRMFIGILAYPCVLIATSGPMWVEAALQPKGFTPAQCWIITAIGCGIFIIICGLICAKATKGRDSEPTTMDGEKFKFNVKEMVVQYVDYFKMKDYKILVFFQVFYVIGYTLFSCGTVYVLANNAGLSEAEQGLFWTISGVISLVSLPVVTAVANKFSKKACLVVFTLAFIGICLAFFFIGINGFIAALIYALGVAVATSSFWGIFYAILYDLCEVYNLRTGLKAEGGIIAVASFIQGLGGALGGLGTGWILTIFRYQGTGAETAFTLKGILALNTLIPAILMAISLISLAKYSLSRQRFAAVTKALEARDNGQEPDLAGIEDLVK